MAGCGTCVFDFDSVVAWDGFCGVLKKVKISTPRIFLIREILNVLQCFFIHSRDRGITFQDIKNKCLSKPVGGGAASHRLLFGPNHPPIGADPAGRDESVFTGGRPSTARRPLKCFPSLAIKLRTLPELHTDLATR